MCPTKQAREHKTAFAVLFLLFEARKPKGVDTICV